MSSTFSSFYVAKSGIQAARANLQITGQNMSNVDTTGYTRQRVDSYSIGSSNNNMRYSNKTELGIGEGVYCKSVSQLRDPYLDVRYRMEHAKTGKTGEQLDTLNDIETIFDETKKNGINTQFQDLVTQLQTFASTPSNTTLENGVKNASLLLTKAFNNTAEQLSKIRKQQTDSFQTNSVAHANNLLKSIAHLNSEIKSADVSGTPALELMDQRNTMIDELSKFANIQVSSKSVPVGGGVVVSELNIDLVSGDKKFNLVSNDKCNQFGFVKDTNGVAITSPAITLTLKTASDDNVIANDGVSTLTNSDAATGEFGGYLSMLNESGEYDTPLKGTERGIGYYEKTLNKLASEFANMMNTTNSTNAAKNNKPLFASIDGTSPIDASNISLSKAWNQATGSYLTVTKQDPITGVSSSTPGDNVLIMIKNFTAQKTFTTDPANASTGTTLFTSSINSFVSTISDTLSLQIQDVDRQDTTYNATLTEIDSGRKSLSSVDVNDEGINLIMYNQSLTASSRFMTTMDEALDTIINNMGRVGR